MRVYIAPRYSRGMLFAIKCMEEKVVVGVMGARGSFTEQAAQKYLAEANIAEAEIKPLVEINAVLEAVTTDAVDVGVFAIQNSLSGIVHSSMHGMSKHTFEIIDFFEIEIDQNLLVLPGTTAAQIEKIVSQRPALDQCQAHLARAWEGIAQEEYVDTAKAAADLANGTLDATTGVVASARCAEIYNLEVLEASIQDLKHNYTTFVAVRK